MNRFDGEDVTDFEKMWNEFSTCVELLLHYLDRTLRLVRRFPLTPQSHTHGEVNLSTDASNDDTFDG